MATYDRISPIERWARTQKKRKEEKEQYELFQYQKYLEEEEKKRAALEEQKKKEDVPLAVGFGETVLDVLHNTATGLGKGLEGIVDFGIGLVGGVGGLFSSDFREGAQDIIEHDFVGESLGANKFQETQLKNSWINNTFVEDVAQGVGQMLPSVAVTVATGGTAGATMAAQLAGMGTMAASAAGNATEEAYKDGAGYYEGLGYGTVRGLTEAATEKLGGFVLGEGTSVLGKAMAGRTLGRATSKGLGKVAYNFVSEGAEEVLSDFTDPLAKTIYKGKDALKDYTDPEYWKNIPRTFVTGGTVGSVMGGGQRVFKNIQNKSRGGSRATHADDMLAHVSDVAKNYGKNDAANARFDSEIDASIKQVSDSLKKMSEEQRGKYLESLKGTPYRLMFDDAGDVATNRLEGYNTDAVSPSLRHISGNLKYAPTQTELSESAAKLKDTLEDIVGDRAHVVVSDSMDTSADGKEGTRALFDVETGVFYVNNKFQFDEKFTELATAVHELYHYAEGTKQSAEVHSALSEFIRTFPEVSDQLTGGVEDIIAKVENNYHNEKLNAMQQGYVDVTEIDADILGGLIGSEEYVTRLAVRNNNLVTKLYTQFKSARDNTQSKQARRALNKLTDKFGKAIDNAKGGVLVSSIKDYEDEEKENAVTSINEENMHDTVDERPSIKKIDGRDIVVIDTDQDVFDGVDRSEYGKIVRSYMKEHFRGKSIDNVKFKNRSEAEYTTSKYTQKIYNKQDGVYESKMRASTELDNLVKTGKLLGWEEANHPKEFNKNGYNRYLVEFALDNKMFTGEMLVALGQNDAMFYDIVKIKESSPTYNVANHKTSATAYNNTISQDKAVVNSNFTQKSEKDASRAERSSDINERRSVTDRSYLDAVERGDLESAQKMVDEVAKNEGYTVRAYHGTRRGDRVGNVFLPERATSGPMAFFTDNKEIAENYAKSKQDTSMAYDPDFDQYETQFRIKTKYNDMPLYRAWGYLPFDAQNRITKKAGQLRENWDGDNELILDPETNEANGGFQWQLKEARGNAIQALTEQWLNSGNLFNEEARFLDVLEMAGVTEEFKKIGMDSLYFKDPDARHEKVYDVFLKINNPFDTATVDEQFIAELEEWYENQDQDKYVRENMASDLWDKNGIDAYDFAERLRNDLEKGTTHAWTSIPDSITDYLKELGYDGIKDIGGKNGGDLHTVWIPFTSEQIKSAEAVTYDDNGSVIPLSKRFDTDNIDIRYSKTGNQVDNGSKRRYNKTKIAQYISKSKVGLSACNHIDRKLRKVYANMQDGIADNIAIEYENFIFVVDSGKDRGELTFGVRKRITVSDEAKRRRYIQEINKEAAENGYGDREVFERLGIELDRDSGSDVGRETRENAQGNKRKSSNQQEEIFSNNGDNGSINERSSKTGKDTVEMSKGEIAKFRANYTSDKVFNKRKISEALNDISLISKLPADVRNELVQNLWKGFNEHRAYDIYSKVMTERLYATIMQETGFELEGLDTKDSKDATRQLKDEIALALDRMVNEADESTTAKVRKKIYQDVEKEINALRSENERLRKTNEGYDEWRKNLARYIKKIDTLKDKLSGKYVSASQYNMDSFKGAINTLSKVIYRGDINVSGARKHVGTLADWYGVINKDTHMPENTMLTGIYSEDVALSLRDISKAEGKLTTEELKKLSDIADHFIHILDNDKKVFLRGKYEDAPDQAKKFVNIIEGNAGKDIGAARMFWNTYLEYCGDPMMVFRRMDKYEDGFWTTIGEMLRDGAAGAAIMEMETRAPIEAFLSKHKKILNDLESKTVTYNGTEIPLGIGMSLYCTLKRAQAQRGLMLDGIEYNVKKKGQKDKTVTVDGLIAEEIEDGSGKLMPEILTKAADAQKELYNQFTEEQRKYIDIVERALNEDCKNAKQETDKKRFGISNVIKGFYWPIKRANTASSVDVSMFEEMDRVSTAGFNKDTVKGARGTLRIESIDKVVDRHIRAVSMYANLATVIDSYNVLYNLDVSGNPNKPVSVKTVSKALGWAAGNKYVQKLLSDIQGVPAGSDNFILKQVEKLRGSWAKYQLGLNPKVIVTQTSSFVAASNILDPDCIARGFTVDAKDVFEYSKLAKHRNYENVAAEAQGLIEKTKDLSDALMKPIGMMDGFVVKKLFGACQLQVQKGNGLALGTVENKTAAGKLLDKVIFETQQNAFATERSAAMRSGEPISKTLTMFTADSMKLIGRVIDGVGETWNVRAKLNAETDPAKREALQKRYKTAQKKAVRSIAVLVSQAIFMALVAQGFRTLYAKDDEDDNIPLNISVDAFGNLIGGLPLVKDIYASFAQGYELDIYAYSAFNGMIDSAKNVFTLAGDFASGEMDDKKLAQAIKKILFSAGEFTGIPTRNVYNFFYGLTKRFAPSAAYRFNDIFYDQSYRADLKSAIEKGDEDMISAIAEMALNDAVGNIGDEKTVNVMTSLLKDGYDVMPRGIGDKATVNKVTYELTPKQKAVLKSVYLEANDEVKRLVRSGLLSKVSNEAKAKAINYIYDTYYKEGLAEALGIDIDNKMLLFSEAFDMSDLAIIVAHCRTIIGDLDENGNTISGSKKAKVTAYVESLRLTAAQKYMIMGYLGYKNKKGEATVRKYIQSLSLTKEQKEELFEESGY